MPRRFEGRPIGCDQDLVARDNARTAASSLATQCMLIMSIQSAKAGDPLEKILSRLALIAIKKRVIGLSCSSFVTAALTERKLKDACWTWGRSSSGSPND
jgi:hypothetical protein